MFLLETSITHCGFCSGIPSSPHRFHTSGEGFLSGTLSPPTYAARCIGNVVRKTTGHVDTNIAVGSHASGLYTTLIGSPADPGRDAFSAFGGQRKLGDLELMGREDMCQRAFGEVVGGFRSGLSPHLCETPQEYTRHFLCTPPSAPNTANKPDTLFFFCVKRGGNCISSQLPLCKDTTFHQGVDAALPIRCLVCPAAFTGSGSLRRLEVSIG